MVRVKPTIVSVVGARPQFIKLAALLRKLERTFNSRLVHTGQHFDREMSGDFFAEYKLRTPDVNLNVGAGTVNRQLARMVERFDGYLSRTKPQAVLVFGDTTSTMAGALAASTRNIPLGHVEAGLRSLDKTMAEEKNRVVTDHLSNWLFCPTTEAIKNLQAERIFKRICPVGDLMAETFCLPRRRPRELADLLKHSVPTKQQYYLLTVHRAEAVDDPDILQKLLAMLESLNKPIIFPVHPRTRQRLKRFGLWRRLHDFDHVQLLPPVSHRSLLWLIAHADSVLTDSGGVQKEAYWAGVRCLTLRTRTEWGLLVDAGWNELVGLSATCLKRSLARQFKPRKVKDAVFAKRGVSSAIVSQLRSDLD